MWRPPRPSRGPRSPPCGPRSTGPRTTRSASPEAARGSPTCRRPTPGAAGSQNSTARSWGWRCRSCGKGSGVSACSASRPRTTAKGSGPRCSHRPWPTATARVAGSSCPASTRRPCGAMRWRASVCCRASRWPASWIAAGSRMACAHVPERWRTSATGRPAGQRPGSSAAPPTTSTSSACSKRGANCSSCPDADSSCIARARPPLLAALDDATATDLLWSAFAAAPPGGSVHVDFICGGNDWAVAAGLRARLALSPDGPVFVRGEVGPMAPYMPSGAYL